MSTKQFNRKFVLHDKSTGQSENDQTVLDVVSKVPDLDNDELESIITLNVSESYDVDNILIIRTA